MTSTNLLHIFGALQTIEQKEKCLFVSNIVFRSNHIIRHIEIGTTRHLAQAHMEKTMNCVRMALTAMAEKNA